MKLRQIRKRAQRRCWAGQAGQAGYRAWCKWLGVAPHGRWRHSFEADYTKLQMRILEGVTASMSHGGPSLQQVPRKLADDLKLFGTTTGRWTAGGTP